MIDAVTVGARLRDAGMVAWADLLGAQLRQVFEQSPHGDWARWRPALDSLPALGGGRIDTASGALALTPDVPLTPAQREYLRDALMALHPWRKGPYQVAGVAIDTEWRSDWKWARVLPHLGSLAGQRVLDVGCGNGYHCWRMAEAGADWVIGIDPTALFIAQFLAVRRLLAPLAADLAASVDLLPLGIEDLPPDLGAFDTVFSMGVLYHRRSPIDHLMELRGALRPGGRLVLETLVVEGATERVLVPAGRYAKMRNVWFIPSTDLLETWLGRCGFGAVRTVDVTPTTVEEQRSTPWMTFESLADFLDPADSRYTIEGYPAPVRAIVIADV